MIDSTGQSNIAEILARANDLLNDRNRATVAHSLANADQMLMETRPKLNASLDNVNRLLGDVQPKISAKCILLRAVPGP